MDQAETPLGIGDPIIPGGVFPLADQRAASTPLEAYYNDDDNYSFFEENREGVEAIIQKEIDAGWVDWRASCVDLGAEYGLVTFNRIGVITKMKQGALKVRLIHDLRRSALGCKQSCESRGTHDLTKDKKIL